LISGWDYRKETPVAANKLSVFCSKSILLANGHIADDQEVVFDFVQQVEIFHQFVGTNLMGLFEMFKLIFLS
jgi:hypothetical protein